MIDEVCWTTYLGNVGVFEAGVSGDGVPVGVDFAVAVLQDDEEELHVAGGRSRGHFACCLVLHR